MRMFMINNIYFSLHGNDIQAKFLHPRKILNKFDVQGAI